LAIMEISGRECRNTIWSAGSAAKWFSRDREMN
jgi:hypothetical protein